MKAVPLCSDKTYKQRSKDRLLPLDFARGTPVFLTHRNCSPPPPPYAEAYRAQVMPDLFEEPRRAIYSKPRKCESISGQDYIWKEDYRPKGKFPGWCLKGDPPHFANCDKD
ncbi:uncharacterized protein TNCV_3373181 [Trichonephila clavipes]|nr:uncharacterized protein TNCV_3373181 [Trichonephila clavipes]